MVAFYDVSARNSTNLCIGLLICFILVISHTMSSHKYTKMVKKDVKGSVQSQFGNVAENYSTSKVHASGADLTLMVAQSGLTSSARVLDAGCGAGHTALAFAPHVAEVIAYDLTPAMLEQVEALAVARNISNVSTQLGDVEALPFDDNSFDAVVSRYSAHHWVNPQTALVEFARVIKPNGQFILSDIVAPEDHHADTFLQTLELLRDPSHVRDHRVSQWHRMMASAGFSTETLLEASITLDFEAWTTRMATPDVFVTALRHLFNNASDEVKTAFVLPPFTDAGTFAFTIPGAVLRGRL